MLATEILNYESLKGMKEMNGEVSQLRDQVRQLEGSRDQLRTASIQTAKRVKTLVDDLAATKEQVVHEASRVAEMDEARAKAEEERMAVSSILRVREGQVTEMKEQGLRSKEHEELLASQAAVASLRQKPDSIGCQMANSQRSLVLQLLVGRSSTGQA